MSPTSAGGGANIITGGEHISPASLKRQEEVLPTAKLEQRRYNDGEERFMDKYIESLCSIEFIAPPPVHIVACRLDNHQ
ncbi:hypothetical protein SAMN05216583_11311 [Selenomonas sp. KH1T6]|nr:hypothetical protein SAMN05216583_11311 [Selenomonas ruminantium]